MFATTAFGRRIAAAALTVVFSSLAVLGAVGPAQADAGSAIIRIA